MTTPDCPLCDAWSSTALRSRPSIQTPLAHAALTFGFWLGRNIGTADQLCAEHVEQLHQLDVIFSTTSGG